MTGNTYRLSSSAEHFVPMAIDRAAVAALGRAARTGLWLVLLGTAYALAARLSQQHLFQRSHIGLFWAPNALAIAALVLTPRRQWGAVFVVCAIAHVAAMSSANPTWRMAWQVAANGVFVVATAEVMRWCIGVPVRLSSCRGVLLYLALAFAMPLLTAATSPGFVLAAMGVETGFSPAIAFVRFELANLSPLLLVTPAVVLSASLDAEWQRTLTKQRIAQAVIILACVVVAGIVVFDAAPPLARFPWLLLLTVPPLVLAAARLGPAGASVSLLCVGALSLAGVARRHGPFVAPHGDAILALHIYWMVIAPPILWVAAFIHEREQVGPGGQGKKIDAGRATSVRAGGAISSALAHELRQPLASMLANAQAARLMLSRMPTDLDEVRRILSDIESANARTAAIIGRARHPAENAEEGREPSSTTAIGSTANATRDNVRPLIGILDDEQSVGLALARLCRAHELDAWQFATGGELLAALERTRPDCLILDVEMPELGGLELLRWLRDRSIGIPAILITGRLDDVVREQAVDAGAYAYFSKPVDAGTLIATIEQALRTAR